MSIHFWKNLRVLFNIDTRLKGEHIVNIMRLILGKFILSAHEQLLFSWCKTFGTSVDRAYQSPVFRCLRTLSRKCSGRSANLPRNM